MEKILRFIFKWYLNKTNKLILRQLKEIEELKKEKQRIIIWRIDKYTEVDEVELNKSWMCDNILKKIAYKIAINSDIIRWHLWEMNTDERIWYSNALHELYVEFLRIKEWPIQEDNNEE